MPKSITFAINNLNKNTSAPERDAVEKALDAILGVDLSEGDAESKLNSALEAHAVFWVSQKTKNPPKVKVNDTDLVKLKQSAAEQRVLLGLKNASAQVLIDLFAQHNEDTLRRYLSDITNKKLEQVPGWQSTSSAPHPGQSIVTVEAIGRIQIEAVGLLLAKKIAEASDNDLLKALVVANNPDEIKTAVRGLGVPYDLDFVSSDLKNVAKKRYVKQAYSAFVADFAAHSAFHSEFLTKEGKEFRAYMRTVLAPFPYSVQFSDDEVRTAQAELAASYVKYVKEAYSAYVAADGAKTDLSDLEALLTGNDDKFKFHMREVLALSPTAEISDEQLKVARAELATSYLKRQFSEPTLVVKAADINGIDNVDKMTEFVKAKALEEYENIPESIKNITSGITEDSLNSLKTLLLCRYIEKLPIAQAEALVKLGAAKNIEEVRPILEQMGIKPAAWVAQDAMQTLLDTAKVQLETLRAEQMKRWTSKITDAADVDTLIRFAKISKLSEFNTRLGEDTGWIDTPQMQQLQQQMRKRALELKVGHLAALGAEQHAELIKVLQRLPEKKQIELLEPANPSLGHLLRATNAIHIKHYLGEEFNLDDLNALELDELVARIIVENERVAHFQKIQNTVLAKALAGFKEPKIETLTLEQIKEVNEKLKTPDELDVDILAAVVVKVPPNEQKAREDLSKEIAAKIGQIKEQAEINKPLIELHEKRTGVGKKILDILLRLDVGSVKDLKNVKYGVDNAFGKALAKILGAHNTHVDVFINAFCDHPDIVIAGKEVLRAALKKEFSQAEFSQIVNEWNKQVLANPSQYNLEQKTAILSSIVNTMKGLKPLLELAKPLETFAKSQSEGFVYDASTREYGAATKQAEYKERLEANTLTLDRLLRAQEQFKSNLAALPEGSRDANIEKIRKELEKDLQLLREAIEHCRAAQARIISIIKDIDRIRLGKEHYLYNASDITHRELNGEEYNDLLTSAAPLVVVSGLDLATKVTLDDKIKAYLFTVRDQTVGTVTAPAKNTLGQFKQTFGADTRSQVNSDGTISQKPDVRVEMVRPPQFVDKTYKGSVPEHAEVRMYMDMALAMLVANGGKPPSTENPYYLSGGTDRQMECLWTALHIICKEKYGYNHSQFMASVKIQTGGFNPEAVMTKKVFREPMFNEHSLFEKVFKKGEDSKTALDAKLHDVDRIKKARQTRAEQSAPTSKALDDYKTRMSAGRTVQALKAAEDLRKTEGVVEPGPKPSELRYSKQLRS